MNGKGEEEGGMKGREGKGRERGEREEGGKEGREGNEREEGGMEEKERRKNGRRKKQTRMANSSRSVGGKRRLE